MIISAVIYILIFIFSTYYLNRERVFIRNENNNNNHHDDIHNKRIRRTYDSEDSEEKEPLSENNSVSPNMSNNY